MHHVHGDFIQQDDPVGDAAVAVTPQVRDDEAMRTTEFIDLVSPHGAVEGLAMDEHHHVTLPKVIIDQIDTPDFSVLFHFMRLKSHETSIFEDMSQLLLTKGRIVQKLKTREALISKANEMLKAGTFTNIGAVAKAAGISKATAYRYFSDVEGLKREASLQLKAKTSEDLFADLPETDLAARLDRLITYHFDLFTQHEAEFRLFLGSVIHESVANKKAPSRGGRRIALIEEALKPLRPKMDARSWDHMVNSLSVFFGIESVTVLKDVCGLANQDILVTWKWAVKRIVYGAPSGPSADGLPAIAR